MHNPVAAIAWLELQDGSQKPIGNSCSIGRSDTNQIVLADSKVSRRHSIVHSQGEKEFWLVDLGSSNGTYLNGRHQTAAIVFIKTFLCNDSDYGKQEHTKARSQEAEEEQVQIAGFVLAQKCGLR